MNDETHTVHTHYCPRCDSTHTCSDPRHRECGTTRLLCHYCEIERFAAFAGAIRDLLRWIDVANKLELASVVLRTDMATVVAEYGCDVDCRWDYDTRLRPGEGCDGGSALCAIHAMQRVFDMYHEAERKLQRAGELIEEGARQ